MAIQDANPSITWGSVVSTTLMNYIDSGKLRDQVFNRSPLLKWLRSGNRVKKLSGGERIRVSLMFDGSGNYKRYSGYEVLDVTPYDGQTTPTFDWKQASTAVSLSGLEKRSNMGESQVRDLAKDRVFQAESTLADGLASDAFSDGTANGSKQLTGLEAMVATTTTSGTYASVNTANNTKWRNNAVASVGAASSNLLSNLRTQYNNCIIVNGVEGEPDAIVTTQTVAEALEALVIPSIRYTGGGTSDLSSEPMFRGTKIMWDSKCPSGTLYILNSKHMFLFVHKDADLAMDPEGLRKPINQDAWVCPILFQGNMACNMRSCFSKLTGIS